MRPNLADWRRSLVTGCSLRKRPSRSCNARQSSFAHSVSADTMPARSGGSTRRRTRRELPQTEQTLMASILPIQAGEEWLPPQLCRYRGQRPLRFRKLSVSSLITSWATRTRPPTTMSASRPPKPPLVFCRAMLTTSICVRGTAKGTKQYTSRGRGSGSHLLTPLITGTNGRGGRRKFETSSPA